MLGGKAHATRQVEDLRYVAQQCLPQLRLGRQTIALCYHAPVKLIGRDLIQLFARKYPDSRSSLRSWTQSIESNSFNHFVKLRKTFGSADQVKPHTVINISGNKYRLIAVVDYALQSVAIECELTHSEYDEGRWRKSK